MNSDITFFEKAINNLEMHFRKDHDKSYTCQTPSSCRSIYDLCLKSNPEEVIEIGTNHGGSMIAIIHAMESLEKSLENITSIDLTHKTWKEAPIIHSNLGGATDFSKVKLITGDFSTLNPVNIIPDKKLFLFYDMHDHAGPWSKLLLDNWVPLIKSGVVALHDFIKVPDDFVPDQTGAARSVAKYIYSGQTYSGFLECKRVIDWANLNKVMIDNFEGGIWFQVEQGIPVRYKD